MSARSNAPVTTYPSESAVPREIRAAVRAVEDARAYARKPSTANLAAFREEFVRPIFLPVLREEFDAKTAEAIVAAAAVIAGTYSRYQDAKRAGLLPEIARPTAYRVGTAKPKAPAKPKAEPKPVPSAE